MELTEEAWNLIKIQRRSGNTTRLADYYIQQLFTEERPVKIIDHHLDSRANERLVGIIKERLLREHWMNLVRAGEGFVLEQVFKK